jgi:hypothetical protein
VESVLLSGSLASLGPSLYSIAVSLFVWPGLGAGEGVAAGGFGGFELHVLDADEVGVVEVELVFAVAAHLFGGLGAWREAALFEGGDDGVHVGDAEGEVIVDADLMGGGVGGGVEHVLDPVGAVGDLEGDEVGDAVFHAAHPVEVKAEDVLVELVFCGGGADDEARVDDAPGDVLRACRGLGGGGKFVGCGGGGGLDKADGIAFGVFDEKQMLAVAEQGEGGGDGDAFALEVEAEGLGVGGGEFDVLEGELRGGVRGADLDCLVRAAVKAEGSWIVRGEFGGGDGLPAEVVGVEGAVGVEVLGGECYVGDAGDGGTCRGLCGGGQGYGGEGAGEQGSGGGAEGERHAGGPRNRVWLGYGRPPAVGSLPLQAAARLGCSRNDVIADGSGGLRGEMWRGRFDKCEGLGGALAGRVIGRPFLPGAAVGSRCLPDHRKGSGAPDGLVPGNERQVGGESRRADETVHGVGGVGHGEFGREARDGGGEGQNDEAGLDGGEEGFC